MEHADVNFPLVLTGTAPFVAVGRTTIATGGHGAAPFCSYMKGFFGPRYTCFGRAGLKRLRKNSWALPVLDPHRGSIK